MEVLQAIHPPILDQSAVELPPILNQSMVPPDTPVEEPAEPAEGTTATSEVAEGSTFGVQVLS